MNRYRSLFKTLHNDRIAVTVSFTGPSSDVETDISTYLVNYNPCGYGTSVDRKETLPDGTIRAFLSRLASCD